jgi:hypothetical protein
VGWDRILAHQMQVPPDQDSGGMSHAELDVAYEKTVEIRVVPDCGLVECVGVFDVPAVQEFDGYS